MFDTPQYNSTLKIIKRLDEIKLNFKSQKNLSDEELEKIHEKASSKLNVKKEVFEDLVSIEPDEQDFLKYLEIKNRPKIKPQLNFNKNNQIAPDLMEFFTDDLIKEFPEVEIEPIKLTNFVTIKPTFNFDKNPIDKYHLWN